MTTVILHRILFTFAALTLAVAVVVADTAINFTNDTPPVAEASGWNTGNQNLDPVRVNGGSTVRYCRAPNSSSKGSADDVIVPTGTWTCFWATYYDNLGLQYRVPVHIVQTAPHTCYNHIHWQRTDGSWGQTTSNAFTC